MIGVDANQEFRVTDGQHTFDRATLWPPTLHSWLPPYPEDAFRGNHEGRVDLLVTIDADGSLQATSVYRSSGNASLDRVALESLQRYRFAPAERDSVPVRADAYVTINWIISPAGRPRPESVCAFVGGKHARQRPQRMSGAIHHVVHVRMECNQRAAVTLTLVLDWRRIGCIAKQVQVHSKHSTKRK
jgi:TonB family protein